MQYWRNFWFNFTWELRLFECRNLTHMKYLSSPPLWNCSTESRETLQIIRAYCKVVHLLWGISDLTIFLWILPLFNLEVCANLNTQMKQIVTATPLKNSNSIPCNFMIKVDILNTCALSQEILIWFFYSEIIEILVKKYYFVQVVSHRQRSCFHMVLIVNIEMLHKCE